MERGHSPISSPRLALLARSLLFCRIATCSSRPLPFAVFPHFLCWLKESAWRKKEPSRTRFVCGARQNSRGTNSCRARTVWRVGCLPADGSLVPLTPRHAQNSPPFSMATRTGCAWLGSLGMVMPKQSPRSPLEKGMTYDAACFARAACTASCIMHTATSATRVPSFLACCPRRAPGVVVAQRCAFAAPPFPPRYSLGLGPRLPALSRGSRAMTLGTFSFFGRGVVLGAQTTRARHALALLALRSRGVTWRHLGKTSLAASGACPLLRESEAAQKGEMAYAKKIEGTCPPRADQRGSGEMAYVSIRKGTCPPPPP